jgi:hypothetical protein
LAAGATLLATDGGGINMIARSSNGIVGLNLFPGFGAAFNNAEFYRLISNALQCSPPSGIVSWWQAEGNANDSVGSNNGTLQNGATFGAGKVGQGFSLDGVNDDVSVPDNANLRAANFTLEAWIKTSTIPPFQNPAFIAARTDVTAQNGYELSVEYAGVPHAGAARCDVQGAATAGTVEGTTVVADGNFHHVACTYDGTTVKLYVDGVLEGSTAYAGGGVYVPGDPFFIGKRQRVSNTAFFTGIIDELRFYNRALTGAEVSGIFACLTPAAGGGGGCPAHTVHGHIDTVPPGHYAGTASHAHQDQHGHHIPLVNGCPPTHAFGHTLGLAPDPADNFNLSSANPAASEPDVVTTLNQEWSTGPARRGGVLRIFRSAAGLFVGDQDSQSAIEFTAPATGLPLYYTTSLPEVRIGALPAQLLFSGLAPGLKGVWQIDILVPAEAPRGRVPVTVSYDGEPLKSVDIAVE